MKDEVDALGSLSLIIVRRVSQNGYKAALRNRTQELHERRGGRPGILVPNNP